MKKRIGKVLMWGFLISVAAVLYNWVIEQTGRGIPCLFYTITGFKCPGCGITHMIFALGRGNFSLAFRYNPLLFCSIPIFVIFFMDYVQGYIRNGKWTIRSWEKTAADFYLVIVLIYWVLRNIG